MFVLYPWETCPFLNRNGRVDEGGGEGKRGGKEGMTGRRRGRGNCNEIVK